MRESLDFSSMSSRMSGTYDFKCSRGSYDHDQRFCHCGSNVRVSDRQEDGWFSGTSLGYDRVFPGLHDDQIATVVPAPVSQMAEDTVASKSLSMHAMPALLSPSKLRCRIGRHTYPATAQKVIVIVYIGCSTHATLIQPSLSQLGCCQKWW